MVYEQYDKATSLMSAFAILSPSGEYVARVVIKYPKDGAGRLRWYVGGRIYRKSAPLALTADWLANAGKPNHHPQPWAAFE